MVFHLITSWNPALRKTASFINCARFFASCFFSARVQSDYHSDTSLLLKEFFFLILWYKSRNSILKTQTKIKPPVCGHHHFCLKVGYQETQDRITAQLVRNAAKLLGWRFIYQDTLTKSGLSGKSAELMWVLKWTEETIRVCTCRENLNQEEGLSTILLLPSTSSGGWRLYLQVPRISDMITLNPFNAKDRSESERTVFWNSRCHIISSLLKDCKNNTPFCIWLLSVRTPSSTCSVPAKEKAAFSQGTCEPSGMQSKHKLHKLHLQQCSAVVLVTPECS